MTTLKEVYKCEICGNIVEVIHASGGTLVCCGQPMKIQEGKNSEEGKSLSREP
ncbi:desulfoferrodoxin FeS4 iron-binding domain-containing protein [archaeon]|nr:desulfoferrodoxin FeS4 iron-binding domain-containing protein [archaeon]